MMAFAVEQLLRLKGKKRKIRKRKVGVYDPDTGVTAPSRDGDFDCMAAILSIKDSFRSDSDRVKQSDRKVVISGYYLGEPLGVMPALKDQILDGDIIYNILDVIKVTEQDTTIAYICHVRV